MQISKTKNFSDVIQDKHNLFLNFDFLKIIFNYF